MNKANFMKLIETSEQHFHQVSDLTHCKRLRHLLVKEVVKIALAEGINDVDV